jgi:hypothetical protein
MWHRLATAARTLSAKAINIGAIAAGPPATLSLQKGLPRLRPLASHQHSIEIPVLRNQLCRRQAVLG